jgi:surfactin synthase thioesterase subunit
VTGLTVPTSHTASPWLPFGVPSTEEARVFCFPNAGAGAASFALWRRAALPALTLCPVQPPGRAERFREPPYKSVAGLVDALLAELEGQFTGDFALFGHSAGAAVAFELASRLCAAGTRPAHLFLSGRSAPHLRDLGAEVRELPDSVLLDELRRIGGTPQEILDDEEVMASLLPLLRADLTLNETYRHDGGQVLDIPVTVFGGRDDQRVDADELSYWQALTTGPFDVGIYPGGHFFLHDHVAELLGIMSRSLLGPRE